MPKVVVTFPQGKHKVLTLSYDDGRTADRRLVELLNRSGIKGTFHLNSGLLGTGDRLAAEEIAEQYRGHEVSAHTVTHPTIARSPKEQLVEELSQDRRGLEALVRYPVRGLSYPNGSYSRQIKELLPYLGIEYARTVESTGGFGMPDDWYEWKPTCHHNGALRSLAEQFAGLHKQQYLYMMYVWGHSYEFDSDNNWDMFADFCEFIGGRDDMWYATNIEIVDYMKSFRSLRFSADASFVQNPSAAAVWLQVDGEVVEVPGGAQVNLV
ncbi:MULTISPECIES: polysaccharide deacetylase family protein [Paenibacillus]|uniref:polysaccharide deacetylase family protein n=1 Tax=Paenibacillus TaxID=44249 RepID=UPI0022B89F7B|nr:polysaccharide deacetylase family protein [Paenibacillus caseinilyticus]MCZ8521203.1 polysaccharide deacetylase family protein [Paenibacillus caseinilyticus]